MSVIVWDIDGVCNNYKQYIIKKAIPFFRDKYNKKVINFNSISFQEIFHATKDEEIDFWKTNLNLLTYSLFERVRPGLKETMDMIKANGDQNVIISARAKCDEKSLLGFIIRMAVFYWIKHNKLPVDKVYFVSYLNAPQEKLKLCKKINPLAVVEDDVENIEVISKYYPIIKYNSDYNMLCEGNNIYPIDCFDSLIISLEQIKQSGKYDDFVFLNRTDREKLTNSELISYYSKYREVMMEMPYDVKKRQKQFNNYCKVFNFLLALHNAFAAKTVLVNPEMLDGIKNIDGKIFAIASHTSLDDIQQVEKVINEMSYFLVKDEISSCPILGSFLNSIGCLYVVRKDLESRQYNRSQMEKVVLRGGNIIVLPEGTRNKTNNLIRPFENGILSISQKTQHPIIPIVLKRTKDKRYAYLKICEPRIIGINDNIIEKKHQLEDEVRKELLYIEHVSFEAQENKVYKKNL